MISTIMIVWLIFINLAGFAVCAVDKYKAIKGKWRIPERSIFGISIIGGSVGVYSALLLFRHKIRYRRFMVGVPIIIFVQACVFAYIALKT